MSNVNKQPAFYEVGKESDKIDVRVSYHIIKLFSDGLYSSPNKAVEELVSNAWDAGAEHVHVIVPPDPEATDGQIVVIDDGTGMDGDGLRQHWLLGDSPKRLETTIIPKGRKPIGKFGIGKLATYVLAHRLTHITKCGHTYYSTSMDYHRIDAGAGNATTERTVQLALRKLTESEAKKAVSVWIDGTKPGYKALKLFGSKSAESWTVAVMSELKPMSPEDGITLYDVSTRVLKINTMHPFVAHFLNEYQSTTRSLPLELLAMSEVLLEAHLYQQQSDENIVKSVLERRDQLLRHLAKTTGRKNAFMVARNLMEAARDEAELERELVNTFASMGFEATPHGGSGKPDGIAVANLSASGQQPRSYSVSLEAKSKEAADGKVSAKAVSIAAIARQRKDFGCDHAIVVGPNFPASKAGQTALEKEIADAEGQPHKTITLIRVSDLARLVTLVPQKRIGLSKLRELFQECRMPEQAAEWINGIESMKVSKPKYREILEAIAALQQRQPDAAVKYSGLRPELHHTKNVDMTEDDLRTICHAMMQLASSTYLFATADTVELNQKPERILEAIGAEMDIALVKDTKQGSTKK